MSHQQRIKILKLAHEVQDFSGQEIRNTALEELLSYLHILEELVHHDLDPASHDDQLENASQVIRSFYQQLIIKMEMDQAQKILTATKPWPWLRNYYFYQDYERLISKEQEMAGFTPYERVAYIGGGALPLSLILYHHLFGIRGVSIEKDPERAEISRKVLHKLDLASHIHVIQGDETLLAEIEFEGYIVDAQAEPKKRVLTHLHASAPSESKSFAALTNMPC
jgi:hypothetical protein